MRNASHRRSEGLSKSPCMSAKQADLGPRPHMGVAYSTVIVEDRAHVHVCWFACKRATKWSRLDSQHYVHTHVHMKTSPSVFFPRALHTTDTSRIHCVLSKPPCLYIPTAEVHPTRPHHTLCYKTRSSQTIAMTPSRLCPIF